MRLLERRARSAAELEQRLKAAGFEPAMIARVLGDLERAGLVDDQEFARLWVATRRTSGKHKLLWELRRKGISEDLIRRTMEEMTSDESELERALDVARRRLREQSADAKARLRLRRFLLGRGFAFEVVDAVMGRVSAPEE